MSLQSFSQCFSLVCHDCGWWVHAFGLTYIVLVCLLYFQLMHIAKLSIIKSFNKQWSI